MKAIKDQDLMKALLVSIQTPDVTTIESEESLSELERLVTTLGFRILGKERQRRPSTTSVTVVGKGKLKDLAALTGFRGSVLENEEDESGESVDQDEGSAEDQENLEAVFGAGSKPTELANVVVFDCDLSPSQLRNLEKGLGVEVFDRTGVIIEIFSRHAKTRAAKLQVEIARLNYLAPRLREAGGDRGGERQAGRGAGESELELDRRNIRDRIAELKTELAAVLREQVSRRTQRSDQPTVALVGYTNAGKSSTMRALTGSEVLVQDKLFATLDTTVRAMQPETHPRILVSDTVGFIKKLPHDLVASFRSTLDEAHHASLLLYVVDSSDPTFRAQLEVTYEVLGEVGVKDTESLIVLNKADRLTDEQKNELRREFPDSILISTRSKDDVKALRECIIRFFEKDMVEEDILARYDVKGIIGDVRASMRVTKESFEDTGVRLTVRAKKSELERLKKKYALT